VGETEQQQQHHHHHCCQHHHHHHQHVADAHRCHCCSQSVPAHHHHQQQQQQQQSSEHRLDNSTSVLPQLHSPHPSSSAATRNIQCSAAAAWSGSSKQHPPLASGNMTHLLLLP
jgi:hypothetical protein